MEKVVWGVTSPIEAPLESNASAEYACESPLWIVAFAGEITMWSKAGSTPPPVSIVQANDAVPVFPEASVIETEKACGPWDKFE
jgi:hypothetical protein